MRCIPLKAMGSGSLAENAENATTLGTINRKLIRYKRMKNPLLEVSRDKSYGGFDFAVSGEVRDLTLEQMNELKAMVVTALAVLHNTWISAREEKESPSQVMGHDAYGMATEI